MELKTNYQYTYFIHSFVIKDEQYQKYILKLLRDKDWNLKIFQKEKDFKLYKYFLPKTREFLFSSFSFSNEKLKQLEELPIETRAALLAKYQCNIFEYSLKKDIQAKVKDKSGIFFNIKTIELICFKTGIAFLVMKTTIDDYEKFENILNFNYKFRNINNELTDIENYDNITMQTNSFDTIENFRDFVRKITGGKTESLKLDIDTERFLTYSYVCVDQEAWNPNSKFEDIQYYYNKYVNILPADNSQYLKEENVETFSKWKYAKLGLTKLGMTLFASTSDMNNYTILPEEYENQYLYTYILNLYKKIYLKKIDNEFKIGKNVRKTRKKFIEYTKKLWVQEITEDETGTLLNHKLQEVFEMEKLYSEVKSKYDVLYKELNIEKNRRSTIIIAVILVVSLIFNILNFIVLSNQ